MKYTVWSIVIAAASIISNIPYAVADTPVSKKSPSDAPADSVAMAIATIWVDYMQPQIKSGGEDYKKGIIESFYLPDDRQSYYRGLFEGMAIRNQLSQMENLGYKIDWEIIPKMIEDLFDGHYTAFSPITADAYLSSFIETSSSEKELSYESQQHFLDEQAAKPGNITTPSGLIFEIITEGEGNMPKLYDKVKVNYIGKLYDGTIIDDTKGEPVIFSPASLIPGFAEGLTMMKPGGVYRIYIPPKLAYGDNGVGKNIPPGAALDFTIEFIDIVDQ